VYGKYEHIIVARKTWTCKHARDCQHGEGQGRRRILELNNSEHTHPKSLGFTKYTPLTRMNVSRPTRRARASSWGRHARPERPTRSAWSARVAHLRHDFIVLRCASLRRKSHRLWAHSRSPSERTLRPFSVQIMSCSLQPAMACARAPTLAYLASWSLLTL
jgi:hypothetical protein